MKKTVLILSAVIALGASSCTQSENSRTDAPETSQASITTTAVPTTTKPDTVTEPVKPKSIVITAEVTDYKDNTLYFTYEGKDYALPMSERLFWEGNGSIGRVHREKTISEKIIHNKFGEKVMGRISINEDMTSIKQCNVIDPNVEDYDGDYPYFLDESDGLKVDPDRLYSFKKISPSKCVVANKYNSYEFDLNDLGMWWKLRYDDEYPIVGFTAYKFKSGNMIPTLILPNRINDKGLLSGDSDWIKPVVENSIGYFGTVQKNENDTAEILLNDGKTVITVPSYFNDGEVKEGMQVMVDTWQTEEKLYGTGQRAEFKEAIIWTISIYYNRSGKKFEDLAYAILESNPTYITKEKFEKLSKQEE